MPGTVSDPYPGPPICKCEHFKDVHLPNGRCDAHDCDCKRFAEIPMDDTELGRAMDDFLSPFQ